MITFDGAVGVGKSTLAEFTANELGKSYLSVDNLLLSLWGKDCDWGLMQAMMGLFTGIRKQETPEHLVLDSCFMPLIRWMRKRKTSYVDMAVETFDYVIRNGLEGEPYSFYLHASPITVNQRREQRKMERKERRERRGQPYDPNQDPIAPLMDDAANDYLDAARYLSGCLDYFIVVDGELSVDKIFADVRRVINERIRNF